MSRIRFEYAVVLTALLIELFFVVGYERFIVSDDNCASNAAAVCLETFFFLDDPEPMEAMP
jgi:hypothetical protein